MNKTLRICIIMQGHSSWTGGTEYTRNLIRALVMLPDYTRGTFEICLLVGKYINREFLEEIGPFIHSLYYAEQDLPASALFRKPKWELATRVQCINDFRYASFFRRKEIDFVYPYYSRTTGSHFVRSAAWIPDFQHKHLIKYFTSEEIRGRDKEFSAIANHASKVVLSSESAALDFKEFFPRVAYKSFILPFRTVPTPAWYQCEPSTIRDQYSLPEKFFLVSNQFWQHKNHMLILKALRLLRERAIHPIVVCTGHLYDYRRPDYSNEILQTIHKFGLAGQVYLLGLVPRMDQVQLMRCSIGVIQPSLFEGWSTVVEDARCLGKNIVLSDIAVHIEQNPPHSHFFSRNSSESLAETMSAQWSGLSPGPIFDHEAMAYENNIKEVQVFGKDFLQLAQDN
jgi:glycosyltransferase involved in cell wall biosynthesis